MQQFVKYFASYSQYGTTTTFGSVGRTLEIFFDEEQRDAWVAEDEPVDGEEYRQEATLRQATAILRRTDRYTVHEPDGSTWQVTLAELTEPGMTLAKTLFDLESRQMSIAEQNEIEQEKLEEEE